MRARLGPSGLKTLFGRREWTGAGDMSLQTCEQEAGQGAQAHGVRATSTPKL